MRVLTLLIIAKSIASLTVDDLMNVLPDEPEGYGSPCSDRDYWQPLVEANAELVNKARNEALKLLDKDIPPWSDKDYLLYSQTGNRVIGQTMMNNRLKFVRSLVLAECFDMNGTFLAKAEEALVSYAEQPTWVLAAHDPKLDVFYGRIVFVDLHAALVSSFLGSTLYLLGDQLSDDVKETIRHELNERTVEPLLERLNGQTKPFWWQTGDSNWNAVCFNGMSTAILTVVPSKEERANALVKMTTQSRNYLKSFFDDGYGSEGVAYFNYGFGEYAEFREKMCEATEGIIDLFAEPKVGRMAHAPANFAMRDNTLAGFGDAKLKDRFSAPLMDYIRFAYNESESVQAPVQSSIPGLMMRLSLPLWKTRSCAPLNYQGGVQDPLRHVFEKAQVVVLRGSGDSLLDMTFKVTGNGGHSHNDIGSYDIASNGEIFMGDAGGPLYYEARTFGSKRYLSPLMNSYGHPVPVVSGKNQSSAVDVQNKNSFPLQMQFTPEKDIISTNISAAYDVEQLAALNRTIIFDRNGAGTILIKDTISMKAGSTVQADIVFTVLGQWTQSNQSCGYISTSNGVKANISILATTDFQLKSTQLSDYNVTWTRVAVSIKSNNAVESVTIQVDPESAKTCN